MKWKWVQSLLEMTMILGVRVRMGGEQSELKPRTLECGDADADEHDACSRDDQPRHSIINWRYTGDALWNV